MFSVDAMGESESDPPLPLASGHSLSIALRNLSYGFFQHLLEACCPVDDAEKSSDFAQLRQESIPPGISACAGPPRIAKLMRLVKREWDNQFGKHDKEPYTADADASFVKCKFEIKARSSSVCDGRCPKKIYVMMSFLGEPKELDGQLQQFSTLFVALL